MMTPAGRQTDTRPWGTFTVIDEDRPSGAKSGLLALQIHQGPVMTIQYKNIRIRKIK